jgi:IS605 OrfB family transposase
MKSTVPAFVSGTHPEVENLIFAFENARRRAYVMKQRGMDRLAILRQLNREIRIPARYLSAAYDSIKALPSHVTFGGKKAQQLRQQGKLTRAEYRLCRNRILACRGEKMQKGNLCLRIVDGHTLRVNVGPAKWVKLPIQIPKKYRPLLRSDRAYTILLRRRLDMRGYDVRITVDIEEPKMKPANRVMALDINSGHVDFAVVDKASLQPVVFGKVDCHELLDANKGKKRILLHRLVNKVARIAEHYGAEVVAGKLRSNYTNHRRRFNRRIQGMNQYAMRQIMAYKLPLKGCAFTSLSENNTTKLGRRLSKPVGLDVHKASAYAFAVKAVDYPRFESLLRDVTFLHEFCAYEEDGIPSMGQVGGSEHTVPHQSLTRLMCNELGIPLNPSEATPNQGTGGWPHRPAQTSILQVKV